MLLPGVAQRGVAFAGRAPKKSESWVSDFGGRSEPLLRNPSISHLLDFVFGSIMYSAAYVEIDAVRRSKLAASQSIYGEKL